MRKSFMSLFALAFIGVASVNSVALPKNKAKAAFFNKVAYAEYVSVDKAPVIDGVRDDVWTRSSIETDYSSTYYTGGTVDIMWNETGLYFFADVSDSSVNASDLCNFWVSETYYANVEDVLYPDVDGSYYLCLNPQGEDKFYSPENFGGDYIDMTDWYTIGYTSHLDGYTLELYVPLYGEKALELNNSIGFDVSVDDYLAEGENRMSYVNWNGNEDDWYWENPTALGQVKLVDRNEENGKAPVPTVTPENSTNSSVDPDNVENSSVNEGKENSTDNNKTNDDGNSSMSCISSIAVAPMMAIAAFAFAFLAKKNKK